MRETQCRLKSERNQNSPDHAEEPGANRPNQNDRDDLDLCHPKARADDLWRKVISLQEAHQLGDHHHDRRADDDIPAPAKTDDIIAKPPKPRLDVGEHQEEREEHTQQPSDLWDCRDETEHNGHEQDRAETQTKRQRDHSDDVDKGQSYRDFEIADHEQADAFLEQLSIPQDIRAQLRFGDPAAVSSRILASDIPRKMSFTGSTAVGKLLARQAADTLKRCTMELGGHAPVLVFDDADIGAAAKAAAATKFRNAGQVCISPTRFYVQEKSYGDFVDAFEEAVKSVKVGNGMEEGVQMGPLVADRRLPVMQDFVDDAVANGATLVTGGKRIGNQGYFYEPTLLKDVPENAKIMNDEPFGPVAPVASFKTEEEIITRANKVKVGLASYAFTSDGERANRLGKKLNTGMVGINSMNVSTPESPFGGVDESGYGSEGGIEGLDAYLRTKLVSETGV